MYRTATIHLLSLLLTTTLLTAAPEPSPAERSESYRVARQALDAGDWRRAGELFAAIADSGTSESDAAMYWTAYALGKQGRDREAARLVARLRSTHPDSPWLDDAEALAVEIGGVDPAEVGDEELKLYALNGLMQADAERAVPVLEEFLAGGHSLRLKKKALFVLSQSRSPRARQVLADIASGDVHPTLQPEAVQYLALAGDAESHALLDRIYRATDSAKVKKSVLESFMIAGDRERLLAAARDETDERLRLAAVELLGAAGAGPELLELYRADASLPTKKAILEGLMISGSVAAIQEIATSDPDPVVRRQAIESLGVVGAVAELARLYESETDPGLRIQILEAYTIAGDVEALEQAARGETDPLVRRKAVEMIGVVGGERSADILSGLYREAASREERLDIIEALFVRGDATALIRIARQEEDPAIERRALEALSLLDSDEALEFLVEALRESDDEP